jgi:chromate reductase, NAD(P)H dehydrogenase (quinone)
MLLIGPQDHMETILLMENRVAIMSASIGMLGGARAQYHLSQIFVFLNKHPVNGPEVIVTFAQQKFDANGNLVDDNTKTFFETTTSESCKLDQEIESGAVFSYISNYSMIS